jgi:hypothetical protein
VLLVEKTVPAEVAVGQLFEFVYDVTSRAVCPLEDVVIMDRVSPNFKSAQSDPAPAEVSNQVARWNLGTIEPGGKRQIASAVLPSRKAPSPRADGPPLCPHLRDGQGY